MPACEKEILIPVPPSAPATAPLPPSATPVPLRPASVAAADDAPSGTGKRVAVWAAVIVAGGAALYAAFTWASSARRERINRPIWTLDLASAKIPPGKASGTISGGGHFVIDRAHLFNPPGAGWMLDIAQGRGWRTFREVLIDLPFSPSENLDGRSLRIDASSTNTNMEVMTRWVVGRRLRSKVYTNGFVLILEFGQSTTNGLPARIFLAIPDEEKTVVAGSFEARTPAAIKKTMLDVMK